MSGETSESIMSETNPNKYTSNNRSNVSRNLQQELRYLKDPLELAKHVEYTLRRGDEEKAAALVRMSSRAVANIVCWNHLIKYQLQKGKHSKALETYNDLKKRGLQPDSYTYLILLDGLATSAGNNPKALGRALSIYHALNGPNSAAAPSIMHTNAALKVCSQAHDLDSIWDILSKLPNRGPHAANATTYTTLLNALRHSAAEAPVSTGVQGESPAAAIEAAIVQAKRVWQSIIERWLGGDFGIDEDLVCAMGRLLMSGSRPRDWDDVFTLVQQTMGIARLTPRLGSVARPSLDRSSREDGAFATESAPIGRAKSTRTTTFAAPSNNTLSLIIGTCTKASLKEVAIDYWSLLTDRTNYGIPPDSDNYHTLLRLFRLTCYSGDALRIVTQDMPHAGISANPKTFRIALAACARAQKAEKAQADKLAWDHANQLVEYMLTALPHPDPQALSVYLALTTERAEAERSSGRQPHLLKVADGSALDRAAVAPRPLVRKHIVDGPTAGGGTAQLAARERASATYAHALSLVERALPRIRRILTFGLDVGARPRVMARRAERSGRPAPSFDRADFTAATRKLLDSVLMAYQRVLDMHALDADALDSIKRKRIELVQFTKTREQRGTL